MASMNTPPRSRTRVLQVSSGCTLPRRLPLPVSVTLHNFVPFTSKASLPHTSKKKFYRPEHSSSLLHAVRLQIVALERQQQQQQQQRSDNDSSSGSDSTKGGGKQKRRERVLFSSIDTSKSVRPTWEHLNEHIQQPRHGSNKANNYLDMETYESLTMRFSVAEEGDTDESNSHNQNHSTESISSSSKDPPPSVYFLHLPIHPSKLVRIDSNIPLASLPLNAVVLHYSDDSIRVTPALFQLLTDNGLLLNTSANKDKRNPVAHDDFSRFDDNVFRTLDQVTPVKSKTATATNTTSLLETDDESQATPVPDSSLVSSAGTASHNDSNDNDHEKNVKVLNGDGTCWTLTETTSSAQDLGRERDLLERILQEEQAVLEQEIANLQSSKIALQEGTAQVQTMQEQTDQVQQALDEEDLEARRVEFLLQAQRVKLFRELRTVFPVTVSLDQRYLIIGLEIPAHSDLYAGRVSEEEISAALGYLAHLVAMMSKYLAVQLRYRLHCNSSRSAIQDDRAAAFPLFQGRTVEREQLEHGVRLLDRNVECICRSKGIRLPAKAHVLAKVKRVYEYIIDGF
jgi:hypothetical protein